jgi:hypothetical protein
VDLRVVEANAAAVDDLTARCGMAIDPVGRTLHELGAFDTSTADVVQRALGVLAGRPGDQVVLATGETLHAARWRDAALLTWTACPGREPG